MAFVSVPFYAQSVNGAAYPEAKLHLYQGGSNYTIPQAGFTDETGGTAKANPVIASSNGHNAVFLDSDLSYDIRLTNADESEVLFTQTNYSPSANPTLIIYPQNQGDQGVRTTDTVTFEQTSVTTDASIGQDLTAGRDGNIGRNLDVTGNLDVGGNLTFQGLSYADGELNLLGDFVAGGDAQFTGSIVVPNIGSGDSGTSAANKDYVDATVAPALTVLPQALSAQAAAEAAQNLAEIAQGSAEDWADNAYNVPVTTSPEDRFSSYHYSEVSRLHSDDAAASVALAQPVIDDLALGASSSFILRAPQAGTDAVNSATAAATSEANAATSATGAATSATDAAADAELALIGASVVDAKFLDAQASHAAAIAAGTDGSYYRLTGAPLDFYVVDSTVTDGYVPMPSVTQTIIDKIDGIEAGATGDQTASEIRTLLVDDFGVRPIFYADFTALRAITAAEVTAGRSIHVIAHTNAGDGGGGEFRVLAGSASSNGLADNNGIVVENTAGDITFERINYSYVDARYFGAVGDDSTVNTTALQAWLDTVPTNAANAQDAVALHLPAGTYQTGKLVIRGHTTIIGDGRSKSVLKLADSTNDHLMVGYRYENNITTSENPVYISGIRFDGNKSNQTATDKDLLILTTYQSVISENLFFNSSRHGVVISSFTADNSVVTGSLADNHFKGNNYNSCDGAGWYGYDGANGVMADQEFINDVFNNNGSESFAQLESNRSAGFTLNQVRTFAGNGPRDVKLSKAGRMSIVGGNFDLAAQGVATTVADAATIYIEPSGQDYINIAGAQVMVNATDNGTTAYNGIQINGSTDYLNIGSTNISTNSTITNGRALRTDSTLRGTYIGVEEGFPQESQTSELNTLTDLYSGTFKVHSGNVEVVDGYISVTNTGSGQVQTLNSDTRPMYGQYSYTGTLSNFQTFWQMRIRAKNSADAQVIYAQQEVLPIDVSSGAEIGAFVISTLEGGVSTDGITVRSGCVRVGSAVSGDTFNHANSITASRVYLDGSSFVKAGSGSPEGSLTAPVGSTYHRTDGGAGTSFYVKESGTGNTGWVAK